MNKEAAIRLNNRWINEIEADIEVLEEKIAGMRKRIATHTERIATLNEEEVKV
jgi:prefoldin subunit 5